MSTLGWIGNVFLIIGVFWVNPKTRWPFLFTMVGEAVWGYYSFYIGEPAMIFICVVFFLLAYRNYIRWTRPPKKPAVQTSNKPLKIQLPDDTYKMLEYLENETSLGNKADLTCGT